MGRNPVDFEILITRSKVAPIEQVEHPEDLFRIVDTNGNDSHVRLQVQELSEFADRIEPIDYFWGTVDFTPEWLDLTQIRGAPDQCDVDGPGAPSDAEPFVVECEVLFRDNEHPNPETVFSATVTFEHQMTGGVARWDVTYPPPHHPLFGQIPEETHSLTDIELKQVIRANVLEWDRHKGVRHQIHMMLSFATALHEELSAIAGEQPYVATVTAMWSGVPEPSAFDTHVQNANQRYDRVLQDIGLIKHATEPSRIAASDAESIRDWALSLETEFTGLQAQVNEVHATMVAVQEAMIEGSGSVITVLEFTKGTCFAVLGAVGGAALGGGYAAGAAASFVSKLVEESATAGGKAWAGVKVPGTWEILWEAVKAAGLSALGKLLQENLLKPVTGWFLQQTNSGLYFSVSQLERAAFIRDAIVELEKGVLDEIMKGAVEVLEIKFMGKKAPPPKSFFGEVAKGLVQGKVGDKIKGLAGPAFNLTKFGAEVAKAFAKLP